MLPHDLKDFEADDDPFQIIEEGLAGVMFLALMIAGAIVWMPK